MAGRMMCGIRELGMLAKVHQGFEFSGHLIECMARYIDHTVELSRRAAAAKSAVRDSKF